MADSDESTDAKPKKGPGLVGILLTLVVALGLGGGGFYAMYAGLLSSEGHAATAKDAEAAAPDAPIFLELDPMAISVGGTEGVKQLRFRAFLQLADDAGDVAALQPRILDIFATYLRALSVEQLEDPSGLFTLRAQLLRRVQLLAGPEAVRDLLIIDFVIS